MFKHKFYIRDILKIAIPIIYGNIGFIMIGIGDVIVAGRHSTDTLAAISIASAIMHCIVMFGIGVLTSVSAVLSNYRGANKNPEKYFYPSLKFAMLLALLTTIVMLGILPFVDKIGLEPKLVPCIKQYLFVSAFGTFGAYLHCVTKEFLQAFEIVRFPNLLTIFCIFLNLFLNILFVFGLGIMQPMGVVGLAVASVLVRYFMGIVLLLYCYKKIDIQYYKEWKFYKDLVQVGLPISLAIMIEFVAFNAITIILGRVSGIYSAAHTIICTIGNLTFMVPLAISNATAVKVGFANGAKYYKSLKNYAYTGIAIAIGFMTCSAIILAFIPDLIIKIFTKDVELIKICIPVLYIVCCLQIFDGLQVALAGIFKGIKHTRTVMTSNFIAYWLISIPLGCYLGLKCGMYVRGFWIGIAFSSVVLCTMLLTRLIIKFKTEYGTQCLTSSYNQ